MDEIPGIVWVIVGLFVTIVSLFLGFIKPVQYDAFFKLMFVVGIGMLVYGYIFKIRLGGKSRDDIIEEKKQELMKKRGGYEADIDIDDYRNNPYLKQEAMRRGYPSSQPSNEFRQTEMQYQQGLQNNQKNQQNMRERQQQSQQRPVQQSQQTPVQNNNYNYNQMQQRPVQRPSGQRFCPGCGTPLLKEHKYCPICGSRV